MLCGLPMRSAAGGLGGSCWLLGNSPDTCAPFLSVDGKVSPSTLSIGTALTAPSSFTSGSAAMMDLTSSLKALMDGNGGEYVFPRWSLPNPSVPFSKAFHVPSKGRLLLYVQPQRRAMLQFFQAPACIPVAIVTPCVWVSPCFLEV